MNYKIGRVPKNYEGSEPTGRQIKDLLVPILHQVEKFVEDKSSELLEGWPKLVGEKIASMTKAVSCENGVFLVKVQNSTLYSLLSDHEKPRLLKQIQETFPHLKIKKILFRMG
jgi:predicted nucleic acid-binding Zn ribbon protein